MALATQLRADQVGDEWCDSAQLRVAEGILQAGCREERSI